MARDAIQLEFADGVYNFRLTLQGINEIQNRCNAGIGEVWSRLYASRLNFMGEDAGIPSNLQTGENARFRVEDLIEPIRQGLIGGGSGEVDGQTVKVSALQANRLIDNYVVAEPLQDAWSLSYAIVASCIEGYDVPDKKKDLKDEAPIPKDA